MPIVPAPQRLPLPKEEPIPATPFEPEEPWVQYAGNLSVGELKDMTPDGRRFKKHDKPKPLSRGPLGFVNVRAQETPEVGR